MSSRISFNSLFFGTIFNNFRCIKRFKNTFFFKQSFCLEKNYSHSDWKLEKKTAVKELSNAYKIRWSQQGVYYLHNNNIITNKQIKDKLFH